MVAIKLGVVGSGIATFLTLAAVVINQKRLMYKDEKMKGRESLDVKWNDPRNKKDIKLFLKAAGPSVAFIILSWPFVHSFLVLMSGRAGSKA